jgi:hypothetical protein
MTLDATRTSNPRVVPFDPTAVFDLYLFFMGLVCDAVDTELHARLGSRTGMYFIGLPLTVSC